MKINIAYGKSGLPLELPLGPLYTVLGNKHVAPLADVSTALEAGLAAPIDSPSLFDLARNARTVAISVCDITRPAPNPIVLAPLLSTLHRAGITKDNITILIATGLHRIATLDEIRTIVGPEIASIYRVLNHDARNAAEHRSLGATPRGTPVSIDTRFLDAGLRISLGLIEPHLMLGFSGGRKLVAPGLAAQETIKTIHSPKFMREAAATEGRTEDNPLHDELLTISRMAGHSFIVDVILTREREIAGIFAGAPAAAHAEGGRFLRSHLLEQIPAPVDAVITSAAGYPLDLTFYQTIKGITAAQHIVKPGGKILVMSECAEGIGSPEFTRMLAAYEGHQQFLDATRDTPVIADQWQLEKMALTGLRFDLLFYTPTVAPAALGALAPSSFSTVDAALKALFHGLPPKPSIAILPEGPYVFARPV